VLTGFPNRCSAERAFRAGLAFVLCLAFEPLLADGEVRRGVEQETGRLSWSWSDDGVSVELVQLLPDQTRAFFLARGFDGETTERIAMSCVFQTIFRNDGTKAITFDLGEWVVVHRGERLGMRTREVWDPEWDREGINEAARIAFRWALLPTRQGFEAGDYNWGMTSYGLSPGDVFDLEVGFERGGDNVLGRIPGIECSRDR